MGELFLFECPGKVLELVGTDFIHKSVTFSPRQGSKLDHECFGIGRGRVYSRVGGVLLTQRDVSKLVHPCFRIDR
jgi:hypothetical protein